MNKILRYTTPIFFTVLIITGGVVFFNSYHSANATTEYISLSEVYVYGDTEWIEVYNASSSPIDINGYKIVEGTGIEATTRTFNTSIIVPANSIAVVDEDIVPSFPELDFEDTGQTLVFQAPDGTEIERITYGGATDLDANNSLKSLQKVLNVWLVEPTTKNAINQDVTAPVITVDSYSEDWTNSDITVTATSSDGTINATTTTFTVNDVFDFVTWDDSGNYSTTTITITNIDKTAPTINVIAPATDVETNTLTYDISGTATDESASSITSIYISLNNEVSWDLATGTSTWAITAELSTALIENVIIVKATDEAGNIATSSASIITYIRPAVDNFTADNATDSTIDLSWSTPSEDGQSYTFFDIRYSASEITSSNFYNASIVNNKPNPLASTFQGVAVTDLSSSTPYYFAIVLHDALASSTITTSTANTLASAPTDTTAPSATFNLSQSSGIPASTNVVLSWTAKGDDATSGLATKYIIKQRTDMQINDGNFDSAITVLNNIIPKANGETETFTVSGLTPGITYYFAVKIQDEVGNNSLISNGPIIITTASNIPAISSFTPTTGINSAPVVVTITGTNFINAQNVVRLTNSDNTFDIEGTYNSATEITAEIATGTPEGIYNIKVINSSGTSASSASTCTVTAGSLPTVTNTSLLMGSNTATTDITITGTNLTGATAVNLDDSLNTALTNVVVTSATSATATIPSGITAGEYNIKITTPNGINTISAVKFSVIAPNVINSSDTQDVNTSEIIDLGDTNTIPVELTLTTDNTATSSNTTNNDAEISVIIPRNTTVTDSLGASYTGDINPPRIIKSNSVLNNLGDNAIIIEMGNADKKLNFDTDFVATIIITSSAQPVIWYYNTATSKYELAGEDATNNGVTYNKGGTVLAQDGTRYTIGLLLDHMSTYVLGVKPTITSTTQNAEAGDSIALTGTNFHPSITVSVNGTSATVITVDSTNYDDLTFSVPSVSTGMYDIVIQNPDGENATLGNGLTVSRACTMSDVSNSIAVSGTFPDCVATSCASGYSINSGTCVQDSGGGGGGGGGGGNVLPPASDTTKTTPTITPPIEVLGTKISNNTDGFVETEKELLTTIDKRLTNRLVGNILLQVEDHGEAWYVDSVTKQRYYLANGTAAYGALRKFGLGITNTDLEKIPLGIEERFEDVDTDEDGLRDKLEEGLGTDPNKPDTDGDGHDDKTEILAGYRPDKEGSFNYNQSLINKLKGRILLQVESRGEAWYINPSDGRRYYMKDGEAAYQIMRFLSLGITNENIRKIDIGDL